MRLRDRPPGYEQTVAAGRETVPTGSSPQMTSALTRGLHLLDFGFERLHSLFKLTKLLAGLLHPLLHLLAGLLHPLTTFLHPLLQHLAGLWREFTLRATWRAAPLCAIMVRTILVRTIMRRPAVVPGMVWAVVRPTRAHPAIDPVQKTIKFFSNPIELVRRIVRLPVRPTFLGRRHHLHPIPRHQQADTAGRQTQPLPQARHDRSPYFAWVLHGHVPGTFAPTYADKGMNGPAPEKFRDPTLVDFGSVGAGRGNGPGRRLELLGGVLVDRPLAQADQPRRSLPTAWQDAGAIVHAEEGGGAKGRWEFSRSLLPDPWIVQVPLGTAQAAAAITLEVRPAPSGQIGVFLEQVPQWQWLAEAARPGMRMLSLFAHSGAATLALAAAGAEVVHVDASKQATALARRNAEASGLAAAPIRWICEDARTFIAREVRRGAAYDGVVLDPPSWGHGPKGQAFSIDRDLGPLLGDLAELLGAARAAGRAGPVLLTCHSPRWHHRHLHDTLADVLGEGGIESGRLTCTDAGGRTLALGDYARWTSP